MKYQSPFFENNNNNNNNNEIFRMPSAESFAPIVKRSLRVKVKKIKKRRRCFYFIFNIMFSILEYVFHICRTSFFS